jgi:hypothetical protein
MHLTYLKGRVKEAVERNVGSFQWQVGKHEEPFIEAFHEHKDKIVYLSPDSPKVLEALNPEHIYIIGGIADVHIQKVLAHMPHANCSPPCANLVACSLCVLQGMTLGKAEQLGIQTACLPIKKYTQATRTVLNINHGTRITA